MTWKNYEHFNKNFGQAERVIFFERTLFPLRESMFIIVQDWIEFSNHDGCYNLLTTNLLAHQDGSDLQWKRLQDESVRRQLVANETIRLLHTIKIYQRIGFQSGFSLDLGQKRIKARNVKILLWLRAILFLPNVLTAINSVNRYTVFCDRLVSMYRNEVYTETSWKVYLNLCPSTQEYSALN